MRETAYYVTVASNFARGFDKYARTYSKRGIPESRFGERFYLLRRDELAIGINKAARLQAKLNLPDDFLMALSTRVPSDQLRPNLETGQGRFIESGQIRVHETFAVRGDVLRPAQCELAPISVEEAMAESLHLLHPTLAAWQDLQPRSVSVLPIAQACQASCKFCFSHASISADQVQDRLDWPRLEVALQRGRERGAQRMVITGGGEPGLLPPKRLNQLVEVGAEQLGKVVLISNGLFLAKLDEAARRERMRALSSAGLSRLALSRHHHNAARNTQIMGIDTQIEKVASSHAVLGEAAPDLRLICVLQRGGVEDEASLSDYLDWAVEIGIEEVCFKELYVSTTLESAYSEVAANDWSREHQIPLSLILEFADNHNFERVGELPWGAPIFRGVWRGRPLQIAAYTEPSVFWERSSGIARSWNVMADTRCLASLEDPNSEITI